MKLTWQKTMLAVAVSAAAGLAYAQQPGTGTNMKEDPTKKDSGDIIDRQTQPPAKAGPGSDSATERKSGQGAGASERSAGEIIDRQTKPGTPEGTSGSSAGKAGGQDASGGASSATSGRIIEEQTKPGTGRIDPAQRGGSTR